MKWLLPFDTLSYPTDVRNPKQTEKWESEIKKKVLKEIVKTTTTKQQQLINIILIFFYAVTAQCNFFLHNSSTFRFKMARNKLDPWLGNWDSHLSNGYIELHSNQPYLHLFHFLCWMIMTLFDNIEALVRAVAFHQCGWGLIPTSMPYVSWISWFSTVLWEILQFSPPHQKSEFDLTCYDFAWFVVPSISRATELLYSWLDPLRYWDTFFVYGTSLVTEFSSMMREGNRLSKIHFVGTWKFAIPGNFGHKPSPLFCLFQFLDLKYCRDYLQGMW